MDKKSTLASVITLLVTVLGMMGAFSCQLQYERSSHQEKLGKLVITVAKQCKQ